MSDHITEKPGDFLAPKVVADAPSAPLPPLRKKSSRPFRYLLPAAVFVVVVAAIAWITQFMPTWRTKEGRPSIDSAKSEAKLIRFTLKKAVWDLGDETYAREMETGHQGHFDFPFENSADQAAEIGLLTRSCDCTHLEVCVLSAYEWEKYREAIHKDPEHAQAAAPTWTKIDDKNGQGFEVPPKAKGLVRVSWSGRKGAGQRLNLKIRVWHQPLGDVGQREFDDLEVPIMMASPLNFIPGRGNVGTLAANDSAAAEFTLWSATRPDLHLEWAEADPRFVYEKRPLSPEEARELEKKLRKEGGNTRVRIGFHLKVTVNEQAGGKQLDQGPFRHDVYFFLDKDQEEKVRGPHVQGLVKGDVIVGNTEDRGKVDMKIFRAKAGTQRVVPLWTEKDAELEVASQDPATLQIKLKRAEKVGARAKWLLDVTVPSGAQFGVFDESSIIVLKIKTNPPRFIRIPVVGNGQSQ